MFVKAEFKKDAGGSHIYLVAETPEESEFLKGVEHEQVFSVSRYLSRGTELVLSRGEDQETIEARESLIRSLRRMIEFNPDSLYRIPRNPDLLLWFILNKKE